MWFSDFSVRFCSLFCILSEARSRIKRNRQHSHIFVIFHCRNGCANRKSRISVTAYHRIAFSDISFVVWGSQKNRNDLSSILIRRSCFKSPYKIVEKAFSIKIFAKQLHTFHSGTVNRRLICKYEIDVCTDSLLKHWLQNILSRY